MTQKFEPWDESGFTAEQYPDGTVLATMTAHPEWIMSVHELKASRIKIIFSKADEVLAQIDEALAESPLQQVKMVDLPEDESENW